MEKEESIEKERRGRFFRAPFLIIALLLVIIAVGVVVILLTPKGNIPVTIESFSPEGEVPQTTNFTIEFSQDLATDSLLWGYLDRVPITFNPPIPGVFKWIARNKLRFFPETFLLPSTEYVAEVRPDIVTEGNYYLKGKRRFSFHTSRFRVEEGSLSLQFGPEVKKEVMIVGQVRFNYPVELEELKRYMTILFEKGVSIPYQFVTQGASTSHRFESEPMEKWEEDQKIELRVNQGLKPVQGKLGLLHGYGNVFSFKGRGELVVERVFSEQREEFSSLKIKLNQVVAVEEAKSYITVDPAVEIQMLPEYQYLELRGDFKAGVGYTVTIKPGMMATDGSVLKKEFSTTVVLENLEPSIDFVGEGIYLSREGNLNLGLATINVEKVLIEIEKVYANNLIYLLHSNALRGRR